MSPNVAVFRSTPSKDVSVPQFLLGHHLRLCTLRWMRPVVGTWRTPCMEFGVSCRELQKPDVPPSVAFHSNMHARTNVFAHWSLGKLHYKHRRNAQHTAYEFGRGESGTTNGSQIFASCRYLHPCTRISSLSGCCFDTVGSIGFV
jgi:hypothetical protein